MHGIRATMLLLQKYRHHRRHHRRRHRHHRRHHRHQCHHPHNRHRHRRCIVINVINVNSYFLQKSFL